MNYYQFHISDWALHTSHLTLEEEAVYRRLLDHYYDTEMPIPEETQSVIRRLRLGSYSVTVGLILSEFFILEADGWHNLRADYEINEYKKKAETARANGKKGGRPKKSPQNTGPVNPEETQLVILANQEKTGSKANQEPRTINQEKDNKLDLLIEAIASSWSRHCSALPQPQKWTKKRRSALKARVREAPERSDPQWWDDFLNFVGQNPFLCGANSNGWVATIDFVLTESGMMKIIEGNYERSEKIN